MVNKKKTRNAECKLATACSNTLTLWWKSEMQIEDGPWKNICETLETCGSRESSLVYAIVLQPSPLVKHNVPLQHINCWVQLNPLLLWNIIRRGLAHAVGWRSRRVSTEHWAAHTRRKCHWHQHQSLCIIWGLFDVDDQLPLSACTRLSRLLPLGWLVINEKLWWRLTLSSGHCHLAFKAMHSDSLMTPGCTSNQGSTVHFGHLQGICKLSNVYSTAQEPQIKEA